MGERLDGRWASKFVGLSVPRQNGKSQLIVARALAGVLLFDERMIIISAHETDTAREVWKRLLDVVESNPTLEARVTGRMDAINREYLSFGQGTSKQTIKLKARRTSGARGFSADCLLLDEAQILGKQAWGSIVPTMSARPNPQLWLFGTPPTEQDDPFAFARVRAGSLSHKARHCWVEWSAEAGGDFDDPATWAMANPSFGVRISAEACADDRAAMDDQQFALERLGIWSLDVAAKRVVAADAWAALAAGDQAPAVNARPAALAVDMSHDRVIAIDGCWPSTAGWHVEVLELNIATDTSAAVEWLVGRAGHRTPVVIDSLSPAASMVPTLKARRVRVVVTTAADMAKACGGFYDDIRAARLTHAAQPQLDEALAGAKQRKIGDAGGWGWDRKDPTINIAPLVAATLAHFGAVSAAPARTGRDTTGRKAVVM